MFTVINIRKTTWKLTLKRRRYYLSKHSISPSSVDCIASAVSMKLDTWKCIYGALRPAKYHPENPQIPKPSKLYTSNVRIPLA